ncbi:MAG: alpha/beta fold hydrolase [Acetobacteraceae bacterium]
MDERSMSADFRTASVSTLLAGTFHRMAYTAWGDPAAPVVLCVHGLTRNGRDFDPLAESLSDRFHVICPDLPGRGQSDWLPDPSFYQAQHYVTALAHLLAAIGRPLAWIGTSLGGICGMLIAATAGNPITRLVLNDLGPFIPAAALARIRDTMADPTTPATFPDLAALERHLRTIHAPFGTLTDDQWAHMARHSSRLRPDGTYGLHYDPAIAVPIREVEPVDVDLWPFWDRIRVPVMAIRGADSDLLLPQTLDRMRSAGARTLEVADAGHAPALMAPDQIAAIRDFLAGA